MRSARPLAMTGLLLRYVMIPRPIFGVAISFMAGIGLGFFVPINFLFLASLVAVFTAVGLLSYRRAWSSVLLLAAVLGLGWLTTSLVVANPALTDISNLVGRKRQKLEIQGIITDDPTIVSIRRGRLRAWRFPLQLLAIKQRDDWWQARGAVNVYLMTKKADDRPRYGQLWTVKGVLRPQPLGGIGVKYSTWAQEASLEDDGYGNWLKYWCLRQRHRCSGILASGLRDYPQALRVLRSLLLGYSGVLGSDLRSSFALTGTLHIFAISGSHVVMMGFFLIVVLRAFGMAQPNWGLILIPALGVYILSTGAEASAVRAGIMGGIYWLAPLLRRRPDCPAALAVAALLLLAWDPTNLLGLSFLLSFVAVAGIIVFNGRFLEWGEAFWPITDAGESWRRKAFFFFLEAGTITVAAWLATTPLIAYYFGVFSPIALPLNVVVVPAASLILFVGLLTLLAGAFGPLGAEIFNHANRIFIDLLLWLVQSAEKIPGAYWQFPRYDWRWLLLWYALVLLLLIKEPWFRVAAAFSLCLAAFF